MNHHREGAGPPLVLAHGVGHHWQGWERCIPALAADFDVIACDSPGFGHSVPLRHGGPPTILAYADAFESWISEQGLDRPHFAGNSMGGAIGLELARRGAIRSVTAFSPAGFWSGGELRWCQGLLAPIFRAPRVLRPAVRELVRTTRGRRLMMAALYRWPQRLGDDEAVAAIENSWSSPAFAPAVAAFDAYRFAAPPEPWSAATTIAWGDHDRLLPFGRQAPRARDELPFAEHLTLGAGHIPMTDDPAAVVAAIARTAARAA